MAGGKRMLSFRGRPAKRRRTTGRFSVSTRGKYSRVRTGLARMAFSRRRNVAGRRLSNMLNKIGETKLIALTPQNEVAPGPIQTGAQTYFQAYCIGPKPTAWTGSWVSLGGIEIEQGVTAQQREGNYVYLDHTRVSLNIDTSTQSTYRPPMEYRVIVGKSRRGTNPSGVTQSPAADLFLNEIGGAFGHGTPGKNGSDLMLQPLNKRDWYIKTDKKFTLSTPLEDGAGGYSGKYATKKNMVCRLPFAKKTKYGNASDPDVIKNKPLDIDYSWFMLIYARSQGKDKIADDWETNIRGTTCFKDV